MCDKCNDTGIVKTGTNDLPCDCECGDTAMFRVAGIQNPQTGAEVKALLDISTPETTRPEQEPRFDSNVSPAHSHNREVAAKLGVRFDSKKKFYVDDEGGLTHDKFGQPL